MMRKIIACMIAVTLCIGMVACTKQNPSDNIPGEPSGATMEVQLSHSYKSQLLDIGDWNIHQLLGDKALLYRYSGEERIAYTLYDLNTRSMVGNTLELDRVYGAEIVGDMIELFNQVWSEEEKTHHSFLVTCDSELNLIAEEEVSDLWREAETPTPKWGENALMVLAWVKDAAGNEYIGGDDGLWCKTPDNVLHPVQGIGTCSDLFFDQKGRLYSVADGQTIKLVNTRNDTSENISLPDLPKQHWNNGLYEPGNSVYDFTYSDGVSVYGVKMDEGIAEELMHWEDSDFTGSGETYRMLEDGRMLVMTRYGDYLASARTQEEVDAIQLISMAFPFDTGLGNDDYLTDMAHRFNREQESYRITIRSYDPDNHNDGWDKLEEELLAGIVPDMIVGDGSGFHNYEAFSNMGLFEDLRPWMEKDPDFQREDYLYNVFEALSYKGRMEQIPFMVETVAYLAKTEHLDGREQPDMNVLQHLAEKMMLFYSSKRTLADSWFFPETFGAYIDYTTGTCSFDSPEFVQLLELLGTLPETAPVENEDAYKNDDILLDHCHTLTPQVYHNAAERFGTEDITIVGNPFIGDKGNGGMFRINCPIVVSSQSKYKEQIWKFIKYCLREDNQKTLFIYDPVNLAALKANYQEMCEAEPHTYWVNDIEVTEYPPTQEEAEIVLNDIKKVAYASSFSTKISDIVREEAGMYLAGDCTAKEAAERIQGRVSLYLAEHN